MVGVVDNRQLNCSICTVGVTGSLFVFCLSDSSFRCRVFSSGLVLVSSYGYQPIHDRDINIRSCDGGVYKCMTAIDRNTVGKSKLVILTT